MASAYEEDKDALNAQFDAAEALLKEIQDETAAVRVAVEEQKTKIDQTTQDVEALVNEMRQAESRTQDEIREIREEVNNVREMLPKVKLKPTAFTALVTVFCRWLTETKSTTRNLSTNCNKK